MPQLISLKFSRSEMPRLFTPGGVANLQVEDFVLAPREGAEDVGFVAAIEYVSSEQLKLRREPHAPIIRRATSAEKEGFFVRRAREEKALTLCKEKARAMNLPMKVTTVHLDLSESRYVYHFTSEQRVDFRGLVRELSALLKSRVELWQIGVRDEARMVDGFGMCGLKLCCSTWLPDFRPINLRMAKDQDINLPPHKLSGQCGRLLCCLSYEVDQYREMSRQLLSKGATIEHEGRRGVIMDRNVIAQSYLVQFEDGTLAKVTLAELRGEAKVPDQLKRMAKAFEQVETEQEAEEGPADTVVTEAPERRREAAAGRQKDEGGRSKRRKGRGERGRASERDEAAAERREAGTPPKPRREADEAGTDTGDGADRKKRRRRSRRGKGERGGSETSVEKQAPPRENAERQERSTASPDQDGGEGRSGKRRRRGRRSGRGGQKQGDGGGTD